MDNEGVKEIADLATKGVEPKIVELKEGVRVLAVPNGAGGVTIEGIKKHLDEYADAPDRRKGRAVVDTLEAFIDLMNRHKDDNSAIFASLSDKPPSMTGVVDYHTLDHKARFGGHRVYYPFPISTEWQAWSGFNGKILSQVEWAAFIEEHIADLASPTSEDRTTYEGLFQTKVAEPAELIQLSRGMSISVEAKLKETRVLQTGESEIVFEEVHKDGSGQKLIVPGLFIINVPLFLDGAPTRVLARLRYRRQEGRLTWFYQLYRADLALREALQSVIQEVRDGTGLPVFEGKPEA